MLEMVVVLVIAGIVTVIAISIFGTSSGKIALEEQQEDLRELFIAGRRAARRTGEEQRIHWESGARQWVWQPRGETLEMPDSIGIVPVKDPETGDPVEVSPEVVFYGNGRARKCTFSLRSENMTVHFQISAATGAVRSFLENTESAEKTPETVPLWQEVKP